MIGTTRLYPTIVEGQGRGDSRRDRRGLLPEQLLTYEGSARERGRRAITGGPAGQPEWRLGRQGWWMIRANRGGIASRIAHYTCPKSRTLPEIYEPVIASSATPHSAGAAGDRHRSARAREGAAIAMLLVVPLQRFTERPPSGNALPARRRSGRWGGDAPPRNPTAEAGWE